MELLKTILFADERQALDALVNRCRLCPDLDIAGVYQDPFQALEVLTAGKMQLILLDIDTPDPNGLRIAKEIQNRQLGVGVIFVTSYVRYAVDAFRMDVLDYLLKPVDLQDLQRATVKARRFLPNLAPRVYLRTFGRFDVFVNDEPLYFVNAKAKELLAVLVDRRGGCVTMDAMTDLLWEAHPYDENVKQLYRKAVCYLNRLMSLYRLDFFVSVRGSCYIRPAAVECDLFSLLNGVPGAEKGYDGEYMIDYPWAEYTLPKIERHLERAFPVQD